MRRILSTITLMLVVAKTAFAADKSLLTSIGESLSSSSYSKVECSMEDYTCQKLILELGQQEALSRIFSGENGQLSVVLQKSLEILRQHSQKLNAMTDEQLLNILALQAQ